MRPRAPQATRIGAVAVEIGDDGPTAGETNLAAVGVTGEIEGVAGPRGGRRHLGGMDQRELEVRGRARRQRSRCCIGVVIAHVVEPGDQHRLVATDEAHRLVDQDAHPERFERGHEIGAVVVAEGGENAVPRLDGAHHPRQVIEDVFVPATHGVAVVAGEGGEIDREAGDQFRHGLGDPGQAIEMGVGEVQQGIAVRRLPAGHRRPPRGAPGVASAHSGGPAPSGPSRAGRGRTGRSGGAGAWPHPASGGRGPCYARRRPRAPGGVRASARAPPRRPWTAAVGGAHPVISWPPFTCRMTPLVKLAAGSAR